MAKRRKRTNKNVPAKGRLRDMADELWALAVYADWNHKCAVCGHGKLNAHHCIPRGHEATRYSLRNGIALCPPHHQFNNDLSPHVNAAGWMLWLAEHQPSLHRWYVETTDSGEYRAFKGTTTSLYFRNVIRELKQYVDPEKYTEIVGVKFSGWLEENE